MSTEVVVEGVGTEIELRVVTDCRCDKVQGDLFSKPIPATELMQWLKETHCYSEFPLMQTLGIDAHIHPVTSSLGLS
ncbi:MAG: EAL domain-containing protein [Gammaproteobacteria bacterium]|nr:EAL domain-containing protein [Gammaproteobacteria bacterium]MBU1978593.1 EAL domain-containing protein [Gammaproteobacteria bacterium]